MVLKPNNSADRSTSVCSGVPGAQMCEDVHLYVCVDGCAPKVDINIENKRRLSNYAYKFAGILKTRLFLRRS